MDKWGTEAKDEVSHEYDYDCSLCWARVSNRTRFRAWPSSQRRYNPDSHRPCIPSTAPHRSPWSGMKVNSSVVEKGTHLASSNSSSPFSNNFSLLYTSINAFRFRRRSNWSSIRLKSFLQMSDWMTQTECTPTDAILVWLASISPLTRWWVFTYGDLRVSATWIEAGPHGIKLASWRSRIRSRDWWTCCVIVNAITIWKMGEQHASIGSTSPWIMLRMEI